MLVHCTKKLTKFGKIFNTSLLFITYNVYISVQTPKFIIFLGTHINNTLLLAVSMLCKRRRTWAHSVSYDSYPAVFTLDINKSLEVGGMFSGSLNWPFAKSRTYAFHVAFLTSFYYDVTIMQPSDGPFDCDVIMEKSAKRCDVGPLAIMQFITDAQMISSALIDRSPHCRDRKLANENMLLITIFTTFCDQNVQNIISFMPVDKLGKI